MAKEDYKQKEIPLNKDPRLINRVKKAGLETFNPQGPWNGYGYEKLPLAVRIKSLSEMRKFNKIKRELEGGKAKKTKTEKEKMATWARRLDRLTECGFDEAMEIAEKKLDYKEKEIDELERRQNDCYSVKREKLINKKRREAPLRYIKDASHAYAILGAHERHSNSDYEYWLSVAHELEEEGEIERGTAKEYAYEHMRYREYNESDFEDED